ncbi:RRXRR domain-containing protein [bacterium]|nr:RRXRR domain-containing protein [bacterium]
MTPKVFVIDKSGKPLLPTHPARARKLLLKGKARVIRIVPFCIQLKRDVEKKVGSFTNSAKEWRKRLRDQTIRFSRDSTIHPPTA